MTQDYDKPSALPFFAGRLRSGIMLGASIFALTGQIAELTWPPFPLPDAVGVTGIVKRQFDSLAVVLVFITLDLNGAFWPVIRPTRSNTTSPEKAWASSSWMPLA